MDQTHAPSAESSEKPGPPPGSLYLPPQQPPGLSQAIASVVLALATPFSLFVSLRVALFAALMTRSESSNGPLGWVAPATLWSFPSLLAAMSIVLGVRSLRLAPHGRQDGRRTRTWKTAFVGLGVIGLQTVLVVAWLLTTRRYMILF